MHFASFHGSYQMLNKLVSMASADVKAVNNQGCNVLHLAAQGNKALSIHYFSEKLDINSCDSKMRTPLHWAVYTRSEVAQNFILAIPSVQLEARDDNGFTALHLAVQSVEMLKSTRPVRALLLKGADRNAKDSRERSPVELMSSDLPE